MLDWFREHQRAVYKNAVATLAQDRKLRPIYVQQKSLAEQYAWLLKTLCLKPCDTIGEHLLQAWLMKKETAMLADFLNALGIPQKDGVVDDLPATVENAKLTAAVENLLAAYPAEEVAVYLHAFYTMNQIQWPNLEAMLKSEPRLQFGG